MVVTLIPLLVLPSYFTRLMAGMWGYVTKSLLYIAGISHQVSGDTHADKQVIYAAKHQSAWETIVLLADLGVPVPVMKRSLLFLPLIGLFFAKGGCIAVDRDGGMKALKAMRKSAQSFRDKGRSILIFPQGTRVKPGDSHPYEIGVFALYDSTGLPVVPIALNSGHAWSKNRWRRNPGVITVDCLEPIQPGLSRKEFMAKLEDRIEKRMVALDKVG